MFKILKKDDKTGARLGLLETKHGVVETPSYVTVGTHASVRTLKLEEVLRARTQLIIVNTYHMWMRLGDEKLSTYGGLHEEMRWPKPLMTDSGGFQVFSLGFGREHGVGKVAKNGLTPASVLTREKNLVKISEEGVEFEEGGKIFYLDAEKSVSIQQKLGADIIFAFDEPSSPLHNHDYTRVAMERTHRWALRSLKARTSGQQLYGIVQGGAFEDLRKESARAIGAMEFDGFALGGAFGSSFGSSEEDTYRELRWVCPLLPEDRPRHLLGIGKIRDLFRGVAAGIDTFDCVIPTREARHGGIWTVKGRIDIKRNIFSNDRGALDHECACEMCRERAVTRSRLHELFKAKDQEAGRIATFHNIFFFNDLMEKIRTALKEDNFEELKKQYGVV